VAAAAAAVATAVTEAAISEVVASQSDSSQHLDDCLDGMQPAAPYVTPLLPTASAQTEAAQLSWPIHAAAPPVVAPDLLPSTRSRSSRDAAPAMLPPERLSTSDLRDPKPFEVISSHRPELLSTETFRSNHQKPSEAISPELLSTEAPAMAPAMEVLSVSTAQMTRGQWGTPEGGPRGAAELMASIRSHPKQSEGEAGGADFERLFPWWGEPDPQQDRAPGPQQGRRTALPMLVEEDGASPSPSAAAAAQGRIEGSSANARRGLEGFRDPSEAEVRRWPDPLAATAAGPFALSVVSAVTSAAGGLDICAVSWTSNSIDAAVGTSAAAAAEEVAAFDRSAGLYRCGCAFSNESGVGSAVYTGSATWHGPHDTSVEKDLLRPGGSGHAASNEVRLRHAEQRQLQRELWERANGAWLRERLALHAHLQRRKASVSPPRGVAFPLVATVKTPKMTLDTTVKTLETDGDWPSASRTRRRRPRTAEAASGRSQASRVQATGTDAGERRSCLLAGMLTPRPPSAPAPLSKTPRPSSARVRPLEPGSAPLQHHTPRVALRRGHHELWPIAPASTSPRFVPRIVL